VRAFYVRIPTEAELKDTGFTPADYEVENFEVWPENMGPISLFTTLQTQLRSWGSGGVMGFDYNVYFARMDRMKLSEQEYEWMFDDIRNIESEALKALNTKD
jgi:hypothetical protein